MPSNAHICVVTVENHEIYRIDWILHELMSRRSDVPGSFSREIPDRCGRLVAIRIKQDAVLKQNYV